MNNDATRRGAARFTLVSDFDGTMTRHDFFELVRERWWKGAAGDPWKEYVAGRLTHFEALNRFYARIRTDEASVREMVREMELDASLPEAIERLDRAGWTVVVASAGCAWYIQQLLDAAGLDLVVHANPGRFSPERGLAMTLPEESPFYCRETGIDKAAVMREALRNSARVAFAGDGLPDYAAALLAPAERVFARRALAVRLGKEGRAYRSFESWAELALQLTRA